MKSWSDLAEEQKTYYRERAEEYDQWFLRLGRYDHGPEATAAWWKAVDQVSSALSELGDLGETLELAAGTGIWTEQLLRQSTSVTAVDASTEVLEINRQRCDSDRVQYLVADLFEWRPPKKYDTIFFGFWLSHVPPDRFWPFWNTVGEALSDGGHVFFVDSLLADESGAVDHTPPESDGRARRKLSDGREFDIVKVFYNRDQLAGQLEEFGWRADVSVAGRFFLYGSAVTAA